MDSEKKLVVQLFLIKILVLLWDIITFPIYYLIERPWEKVERQSEVRARREEESDLYSPWVRLGKQKYHYIFSCKTIPEAVTRTLQVNGREQRALGYREILGEEDEVQKNGKVLRKYILSDYKWLTLGQVDERIEQIGRGLLYNGVRPKTTVMIFAETRLEWFLTAHAILRIGASISTLYATLGDEGIIHGINETEVTQLVTTQDLLPKLAKLQSRIPNVHTIFYVETLKKTSQNGFNPDQVKLVSYSQLEDDGKTAPDDLVGVSPSQDDIAVIMYTSGSTGVPKGVIETHKNFLAACCSYLTICEEKVIDNAPNHTYLAYLPLAHSLEFTAESFMFIGGVKIGFGTPYTLTDQGTAIKRGHKGDVTLLKPTVMAGVPLILDRIRKTIYDKLDKRPPLIKRVFDFVIDYKVWWQERGFTTPVIDRLICKNINKSFGGNLEFMLVGSAPLSPETQKILKASLNIKLLQGYGSTETSSAATLMDLYDVSLGRIGAPLFGVKIRLIDWAEGGYRVTDKPNPRGEIIVGGNTVTKGYFKLEQQTNQDYEESHGTRWFNTGDIGEVFPDGTFKIIDRKKDLVKLQYGEYISLGKVEAELKSCQLVDNICVYGDSFHCNLVAIVVPNTKYLKAIAVQVGNKSHQVSDWCKDPKIINHFTDELTKHGLASGLFKVEIPTKYKLCPDEWTPSTGLVTAALKLKRKNIQNHYQRDIDIMYGKTSNNTKSA